MLSWAIKTPIFLDQHCHLFQLSEYINLDFRASLGKDRGRATNFHEMRDTLDNKIERQFQWFWHDRTAVLPLYGEDPSKYYSFFRVIYRNVSRRLGRINRKSRYIAIMTLDETKLFDRASVEARNTSLLSRHVGLQFVKLYYSCETDL